MKFKKMLQEHRALPETGGRGMPSIKSRVDVGSFSQAFRCESKGVYLNVYHDGVTMRWQDVLADKSLHDLPYKIELNERGNIEMSPASVIHSLLQGKIAFELRRQLRGEVFTELAVETRKGVKVPDVAWATEDYARKHIRELCASTAPEICVEIISPSNSQEEMEEKTALFLDAGAVEVWLVDEAGNIRIYTRSGQQPTSEYPVEIKKLL